MNKNCLQCNKQFEVTYRNPTQKYCSKQCRSNSQKRVVITHCDNCNREIEVSPSRFATYNHHFCSKPCATATLRVGKPPTNKKATKTKCANCKKTFEKSPSAHQKYCSKKCCDEAKIGIATTPRIRVKRVCVICNTEFDIIPSALKRDGAGKFCSRACQNKYKTTIKGENHPLKKVYPTLVCEWCGKIYRRKPSEAAGSRFCSNMCHGSYTSHNIGRNETSIERSIRLLLESMKIYFIQEKPMGPYSCDFYIPSCSLVIECDGDYWHRGKEQKAKDARKDKWLTSHKIKVIRFPEHEILNNIDKCKAAIESIVKPRAIPNNGN